MRKLMLATAGILLLSITNLLAQRVGSNLVEIKFIDGEVVQLDLRDRDNEMYHKAILQERCYEIVYWKIQGEKVYRLVSEMPKFNSGNGDLKSYINKHLKYPQKAIDENLEGIVFVNFTVDQSGKIKNASIWRGVGPVLDKAALSLINSLPDWTPGKLEGETVEVNTTVPIRFKQD